MSSRASNYSANSSRVEASATSTCSMLGRTFMADSSKGKVLVRFIPRASDYRMNERTDTFTAPNNVFLDLQPTQIFRETNSQNWPQSKQLR